MSDFIQKASCDECPRGTCRLPLSSTAISDVCKCPEEFLGDTFHHGQCELKQGTDWPQSVNKTELDRRRCNGVKYGDGGKTLKEDGSMPEPTLSGIDPPTENPHPSGPIDRKGTVSSTTETPGPSATAEPKPILPSTGAKIAVGAGVVSAFAAVAAVAVAIWKRDEIKERLSGRSAPKQSSGIQNVASPVGNQKKYCDQHVMW